MTRPLFQTPAQRRTTFLLLATVVLLAVLRTLLVHYLRDRDIRVRALTLPKSQALALAHGLFLPGRPEAFLPTRHLYTLQRQAINLHARLHTSNRLPAPAHDAPTQLQRVQHVVARLSFYDGYGNGNAGFTHVGVSVVGIVGMFAAIVGALLGPWLADGGDEGMDEDGFSFWAGDDDEADVRLCGRAREERLWMVRLFEPA